MPYSHRRFIHLTEGMNHERITQKWQGRRAAVVCITALVIYVPLLFIVVQSFLSAPFFSLLQIVESGSLRLYFYRPGFLSGIKVRVLFWPLAR